jgi:PhzF family phenazine biosynthesis protein
MIETFIVDAFTDQPFKGNPAGVCILQDDLDDNRMLSIANELGFSETAYVRKSVGDNKYSIRYFSPKKEIPLCGHATLASSKVLFEKDASLNKIHFVNIQNLDLIIRKDGDMISMEFPLYDTVPAEVPKELLHALGLKTIVNSEYNRETNILLLEIDNGEILKNLKPDFEALYRSHNSINGVLVTSRSSSENFDFESRYFWPWAGTNEDPVTGGTHTFLTNYWSKRLGKMKMNAFQSSVRSGFYGSGNSWKG